MHHYNQFLREAYFHELYYQDTIISVLFCAVKFFDLKYDENKFFGKTIMSLPVRHIHKCIYQKESLHSRY